MVTRHKLLLCKPVPECRDFRATSFNVYDDSELQDIPSGTSVGLSCDV
jgi:hypothetical protein